MGVARRIALVAALAVAAAAPAATADSSAKRTPPLVQFRSCSELLDYAKARASPLVGPWGFAGAPVTPTVTTATGSATAVAAAAGATSGVAGVDYSTTNVQEEGVDEPDLVKTDGVTLFVASGGTLRSVDVAPRPRLLDSLKLDAGWSNELLLHGRRLLVISRGGGWVVPLPGATASVAAASVAGSNVASPGSSTMTEVDVSDPSALRVVRTMSLDGSYLAARLVGSTVRLVVSSRMPDALPFDRPPGAAPPDDLAAARERNRAVVASSPLSKWLPTYRVSQPGAAASAPRPLVQCRHVLRPRAFSGLGMLTVLTLDLARGLEPVDSLATMTDGKIVYASPKSLYVASERWVARPTEAAPRVAPRGVTTELHKFDISSSAHTRYRGSGSVSGYLLNQWSLSEYKGVLRVVSSDEPAWWGASAEAASAVHTLRSAEGSLVQVGSVGDIGRGEPVYAVRFVGDVGFVVTFRQFDPLHTLDLADAERPRLLGELRVPGYSSYLHPIGDGLLLGVGRNAGASGPVEGTQLSLFDVSDLRRPARLAEFVLGRGWSEAEADHHAFLFWPRTGLVVVPFVQDAAAFRVGRGVGIDRVGWIHHDAVQAYGSQITRSVVVGDSLLTISYDGVKASSLATLADRGWATFPRPDPTPPPPVLP